MSAAQGNEAGDLSARRIAYSQDRQQARRARTLALVSSVCVDEEDLIRRGGSCDVSSLSRITHHRLCARALVAEGIRPEDIAAAWGETTAAVVELLAHPLIDPDHEMEKIDGALRLKYGLADL